MITHLNHAVRATHATTGAGKQKHKHKVLSTTFVKTIEEGTYNHNIFSHFSVAKLQMEVALERQRLESLKKALDIERSTQASMAHHYQRQAKIYAPVYGAYQ